MSKLPPLAAIRAFEAAARLQNFSRAAEELGMTQAAISYQVRQLEDNLGVALTEGPRNRLVMTVAGLKLAEGLTAVRRVGEFFSTGASCKVVCERGAACSGAAPVNWHYHVNQAPMATEHDCGY